MNIPTIKKEITASVIRTISLYITPNYQIYRIIPFSCPKATDNRNWTNEYTIYKKKHEEKERIFRSLLLFLLYLNKGSWKKFSLRFSSPHRDLGITSIIKNLERCFIINQKIF